MKKSASLYKKIIFHFLILIFLTTILTACTNKESKRLVSFDFQEFNSGWFTFEPYQMEVRIGELEVLTGLDIQIARKMIDRAGHKVFFKHMTWSELITDLQSGEIDFIMSAYHSKEREEFVHFSIPYRTEQNAVYYHKSLKKFNEVKTIDSLFELVSKEDYNIATVNKYAFSPKFKNFLTNPPSSLKFVSSISDRDCVKLVLNRQADFFVSNPVIMDKLLTTSGLKKNIKKLQVKMEEIPVYIMFSRKSVSTEQVMKFNAILKDMKKNGFIRSLHINYILPSYLAITTQQTWFTVLNLLGIAAFCTSGVLLARKERYNIFGALVLAILPAIGGGVLRDLFLGKDKVFILQDPEYLLIAFSIVIVAFFSFKFYDFCYYSSSRLQAFGQYTLTKLSKIFGQLYKLLDAWAVASFSIIGVSVSLEAKTTPIWLWGPAIGVLTATGGVILRDIVRADFNIDLLKQDTYAELSLFGSILYTSILILLPYHLCMEYMFVLTISIVITLFAIRLFILWRGYTNPLQFGKVDTHPDIYLQYFINHESKLWQHFANYYIENENGHAVQVSKKDREELNNQIMYLISDLKHYLNLVAAEPLSEQTIKKYKDCSARLDIAVTIKNNLNFFLESCLNAACLTEVSDQADKLEQQLHESLKALLETASSAIESEDITDLKLLDSLTSKQQERFQKLRIQYGTKQVTKGQAHLNEVLQATYTVERIIYLLGDYTKLRLNKNETYLRNTANRKSQQSYILNN